MENLSRAAIDAGIFALDRTRLSPRAFSINEDSDDASIDRQTFITNGFSGSHRAFNVDEIDDSPQDIYPILM